MDQAASYDIFVIGGGINGCGIARDAVGRGYSVFLAEMNDLASGTSSGSTKLIHGGLRYLEYYEFRLVRESLMEREVLWRMAPHIIWPMRFVLPHADGLRPAWLLRLGLFLYDHIGGRKLLPATTDARHAQRSGRQAAEAAVHAGLRIFGLLGQRRAAGRAQRARRGRSRRVDPHPRQGGERAPRRRSLDDRRRGSRSGAVEEVRARLVVNAAGPWVDHVLSGAVGQNDVHNVRLVQGSHIVVEKKFDDPRAYFFQNRDGRIIFAIPYEEDFTLIGTTDQDYQGDPAKAAISDGEIDYLCDAASEYFASRCAARTSSGPIPACARSTTTAPRRRRRRRATTC